jgi:hypothetical protein
MKINDGEEVFAVLVHQGALFSWRINLALRLAQYYEWGVLHQAFHQGTVL